MLKVRDIVQLPDGRRGVILPTISLLREDGPLSVIAEGEGHGVVLSADYAAGLVVLGQRFW